MLTLHPFEPHLFYFHPIAIGVVLHIWQPLIAMIFSRFLVYIIECSSVRLASGVVTAGVLLFALIRPVISLSFVATTSTLTASVHHLITESGERLCKRTDHLLHVAHLGVLAILCCPGVDIWRR